MPNEERIGMYENQQAIAHLFELKMCSHYDKKISGLQKFKDILKLEMPKRQRRKPPFTEAEIKQLGKAAAEVGCTAATLKKGDVTIELVIQPQVNQASNEWDEIISNNEGKW